ncbi:MAG: tRNA (adenosine(37)-N6)-threonylcarbamoyltransferase complex ATPase subunit type 1 TsaE [Acidimicrobiia bacterium]|nr:tRNA (adenosine(37)-N6)-threonylcarbamoyltransferase complex ATPase subunit type 1 TsaE [Acidimicrobiia bacterium]
MRFGSIVSHSSEETFGVAKSIGESLNEPAIFFLEGNLGAGKTVFAKGLVCGLGQPDPDDVTSPSFTLINEYDLRVKVFHIDLYRLESREDLRSLDLEEIFAQRAVILVEWAEKLGNVDLPGAVRVRIHDLGNDQRLIEIGPTSLDET